MLIKKNSTLYECMIVHGHIMVEPSFSDDWHDSDYTNLLCTSEILNTHHFLTTKYPFSTLYLPTQIPIDIVF